MGKKLYVGNISYNTDEKRLREAFESCGIVESVTIIMDRATGDSKGFGFIQMSSEEEAKAALEEWNGKELDGRNLRVSEAHHPDR